MKIAAIEETLREDPGDLASWLAYGDRLLEQGDARGTLIRLEQRRARLRPADRAAVESDIAALVAEHRQGWDAALPPGATVLERRYGFATKVAVEWSDAAPVQIEQALRGPFVTGLRITPPPSEGDDDYRYWEDDLDDDGEPNPAGSVDTGGLATLDLGRLTELDLSYLRIGALGAKTLAVSAYLRAEAGDVETAGSRLESLDLRYSRVGNTGLAALAASPVFAGVRRLHLQRNVITEKGMPSLHRFENLTELDLRYNEIGTDGARALLAAPFAGALKRLYLYREDVGGDGAALLAKAPQLPPALRSYWRSA
ncbi:hypothetical protein ACQPZP_04025 [Spirillospora sp. CA-142024]|uniref:hypothetical protein n=1 Tax=Spirillospora sp. CA-142024 TaxID=3240036 RepID=UPI003D948C0F